MMKFKNKFAAIAAAAMTGVMAFGLVATVAPVVAVYATEEDNDNGDNTGDNDNGNTEGSEVTKYSMDAQVQYDRMLLKVKTSDPYFTVDVLKSESDREKASKSYTYANVPTKQAEAGELENGVAGAKAGETDGYVEIDLGFLKLKGENILNVYGSSVTDKNKGTIVKVAGQPEKEKLTVKAAESTLPKALGKSAADYQYKPANGGFWSSIDQFDFTAAKVAGATIVVRKAATGSAPAGPEIKVKIPAAAKAPKVTVDYAKGTVKLTEKMEIALLTGKDPIPDEKSAWTTATKAPTRSDLVKALKIADEKASEAFTIVVRTAENGKKAASMPVIVKIKETPVLELVKEKEEDTTSAKASVTIDGKETTISAKWDDKGVLFTVAGDGKASFQYDKGGDKWANITDKAVKVSGTTVKVRVAPEKEDKRTPGSGAFSSKGVDLTPEITVKGVEIEVKNGSTVLKTGDAVPTGTTLTCTANVTGAGDKAPSQDVEWTVTGLTGLTVGQNGALEVGNSEGTIIITAKSKADASKTATFTVKIEKPAADEK